MVMEADLPDEEEQMPDYYSMGGEAPEDATPQAPQKPESFAEPADHSEGVTVDPSADMSFDDGTF